MFKGHPKGLYALALANTGERFGYYTMLAIFVLFLQAKFGFTAAQAGQFYGFFLAGVYFMPLIGGILADKFGYGKMVTLGIVVIGFRRHGLAHRSPRADMRRHGPFQGQPAGNGR